MKIKVIICVLLSIYVIWHAYSVDQRKRTIAICIERGLEHFKGTGQFPYIKEGLVKYLTRDVAQARCSHNPDAFK